MGLYDVDKSSEDRGAPAPNTHDKVIDGAHKSHKTLSTHYTTDADTNAGRLQMQNKQILGNDGTTNITLYGYNQALNQWGFFVTKPGVEVTTNTDLSQFIFNSNQDVFKIVSTISISATATAGNQYTTASKPHGLSFVPSIQAYIQVPSSLSGNNTALNHANPAMIYGTVAGVFRIFALCEVTVDATNINISIQTDTSVVGGTYLFTAKVYLLQETFS